MNTKFKPFGITFEGNTVCINLRFHPTKFNKMTIGKYGRVHTSKNGYIIFSAELNKYGDEYYDIQKQLATTPS